MLKNIILFPVNVSHVTSSIGIYYNGLMPHIQQLWMGLGLNSQLKIYIVHWQMVQLCALHTVPQVMEILGGEMDRQMDMCWSDFIMTHSIYEGQGLASYTKLWTISQYVKWTPPLGPVSI